MTHAFGSPHTSSRESAPDVGPNDSSSGQSSSGHIIERGKKTKDRSMSKDAPATHSEDNNSVRLRNSCRSCANSKVRCNKAKPTCSRCEDRGIDCQYLQSKRPGRVPSRLQPSQPVDHPRTSDGPVIQPATSGNNNSAPASFPLSLEFGLEDYGADDSRQRTDSAFSIPSTGTNGADFFATPLGGDVNSNMFYVGNASIAPMGSISEASHMEDTMTSEWTNGELNLLDQLDLNSWWSPDEECITDFTNDSSSLRASDYTSLAASTEPSSLAPSSSSSTVQLKDLLETTVTSRISGQDRNQLPPPLQSHLSGPGRPASSTRSRCACMAQALDLLKNLSSTESPEPPHPSMESYTQRVLMENQQDIDANLAMLACRACSNDRFLLMILLMIAARILGRYVAAAASCGPPTLGSASSEMPSTTHGEEEATLVSDHADRLMEMSRAWGGFCMMLPAARGVAGAQSPSREAVQRVLRELHRVQRLLAQLSIRRKSLGGHKAERQWQWQWDRFEAPAAIARYDRDDHHYALAFQRARKRGGGCARGLKRSIGSHTKPAKQQLELRP
ncbi:hypothetical protein LTR33_003853 [Friedmanniomyces endolithicus]|nr:hypothetical protein LTR33_003853 [Friedmanniomyces endolithicus]